MFHFYTPLKTSKSLKFPDVSGSIEIEHYSKDALSISQLLESSVKKKLARN